MDWDAIGAIGEVVGAAGVIFSLIYLGTQIRSSTRQAKADAIYNLDAQYLDDAASALGIFANPDDRLRYAFVLLSLFRTRETLYFQKNEGTTAFESWSREDVSLRTSLASEATREWWREAKTM